MAKQSGFMSYVVYVAVGIVAFALLLHYTYYEEGNTQRGLFIEQCTSAYLKSQEDRYNDIIRPNDVLAVDFQPITLNGLDFAYEVTLSLDYGNGAYAESSLYCGMKGRYQGWAETKEGLRGVLFRQGE